MKKLLLTMLVVFLLTNFKSALKAQESDPPVTAGMDIYSSYVWRGARFGSGPAFQPNVEWGAGSFAAGAWGSVAASDNEGYEMDLYASYSFDFGLQIAFTDYYFGGMWFDQASHFFEPALGYEMGAFSFTAAYMMGEEVADTYLEAAATFRGLDFFIGAGDGQYTADNEFMLCNIGVGTTKEIPITEVFQLPLSGAVILNPSTEQFFVTAGITL